MPVFPSSADPFYIPQNEITLVKQLGEGGFGEVFSAQKDERSIVAVKKVRKDLDGWQARQAEDLFYREIAIWRVLQHPNVTQFLGFSHTPAMIVMELVNGGDLFSLMEEGNISRIIGLKIAIDIASALAYLHTFHIVYRDLKPENVLIETDGAENIVAAKLTDFGLATYITPENPVSKQAGTAGYMAPEVIQSQVYDETVDVFSHAILTWEILTGKFFSDNYTILTEIEGEVVKIVDESTVNKIIVDGIRPSLKRLSGPVVSLLTAAWSHRSNDRPVMSMFKEQLEQIHETFTEQYASLSGSVEGMTADINVVLGSFAPITEEDEEATDINVVPCTLASITEENEDAAAEDSQRTAARQSLTPPDSEQVSRVVSPIIAAEPREMITSSSTLFSRGGSRSSYSAQLIIEEKQADENSSCCYGWFKA